MNAYQMLGITRHHLIDPILVNYTGNNNNKHNIYNVNWQYINIINVNNTKHVHCMTVTKITCNLVMCNALVSIVRLL